MDKMPWIRFVTKDSITQKPLWTADVFRTFLQGCYQMFTRHSQNDWSHCGSLCESVCELADRVSWLQQNLMEKKQQSSGEGIGPVNVAMHKDLLCPHHSANSHCLIDGSPRPWQCCVLLPQGQAAHVVVLSLAHSIYSRLLGSVSTKIYPRQYQKNHVKAGFNRYIHSYDFESLIARGA